jgi:hypothetical protein
MSAAAPCFLRPVVGYEAMAGQQVRPAARAPEQGGGPRLHRRHPEEFDRVVDAAVQAKVGAGFRECLLPTLLEVIESASGGE